MVSILWSYGAQLHTLSLPMVDLVVKSVPPTVVTYGEPPGKSGLNVKVES
jgi:hypothetical protein